MFEDELPNIRDYSKARFWLITLVLLVGWGAFVIHQGVLKKPTGEELYTSWREFLSPAPPNPFVEYLETKWGIRHFSMLHMERWESLTWALLDYPDYAFEVGAAAELGYVYVDLAPNGVWPFYEKALKALASDHGSGRLEVALARATIHSPWQYDIFMCRSAWQQGKLREVESCLHVLRVAEREGGLSPEYATTLERTMGMFQLTSVELAREWIQLEDDPANRSGVEQVVKARGMSTVSRILGELSQEVVTNSSGGEDWRTINLLLTSEMNDSDKTNLLTWLIVSSASREIRVHHHAEILAMLHDLPDDRTERLRAAFSNSVRDLLVMEVDSEDRWEESVDLLMGWASVRPDAVSWPSIDQAERFILKLCENDFDAQLEVAVRHGGNLLSPPLEWVETFFEHEKFDAMYQFAELAPDKISPNQFYEKEQGSALPNFRSIGKLPILPGHEQCQAFLELVFAFTGAHKLQEGDDREVFREAAFRAINKVNEVSHSDRGILEQVVDVLSEQDSEFFAAGRGCFDQWRQGATFGGFLHELYTEDYLSFQPRTSFQIWSNYAEKLIQPEELRILQEFVENSMRPSVLSDQEFKDKNGILEGFLQTRKWTSSSSKAGAFDVGSFVVQKLVENGKMEEAVRWTSEVATRYEAAFPRNNVNELLECFYDGAILGLRGRGAEDALKLYGLVIDERDREGFDWPTKLKFYEQFGSVEELDAQKFCSLIDGAVGKHPLKLWLAGEILAPYNFSRRDDGNSFYEELLQASPVSYLKQAITNQLLKKRVLPGFEDSFNRASPGARRYLALEYLKALTAPEGEQLVSPENRAFLTCWVIEELLAIVERGDYLSWDLVDSGLSLTQKVAREIEDRSRIEDIFERVHTLAWLVDDPRFSEASRLGLREWKARSAYLREEGLSERDNLVGNDGIPLTERVWLLAKMGEIDVPRKLMESFPGELDFRFLSDLRTRESIGHPGVRALASSLPVNSNLELYARLYTSPARISIDNSLLRRQPALSIRRLRNTYQLEKGYEFQIAQQFEEAEFASDMLEARMCEELLSVFGTGRFMPAKIKRHRERLGEENLKITFLLGELEGAMVQGDYDLIPWLAEDLGGDGSFISIYEANRVRNLLRTVENHFLFKVLGNESFSEKDSEILRTLAFGAGVRERLGQRGELDQVSDFRQGNGDMAQQVQMQAIVYGLNLIEKGERGEAVADWADCESYEGEGFAMSRAFASGFCFNLARVLGARVAHWDANSRWALLGMLQSGPPGWGLSSDFNLLGDSVRLGLVSEDEFKDRARDFALEFPRDGWSFLSIIVNAKAFGDELLERFGRENAEKYFESNPRLKERIGGL